MNLVWIKPSINFTFSDDSVFLKKIQDGPGLCFCPEFGVPVRSSELDRVNPGSEFGVRNGSSLVRQVRSSEKVPCRTLVRQVQSSEKGPFLSSNSEPWQIQSSEKGPGRTLVRKVRSSEKGPFLSPNSEPWQVRSLEKGPGRTLVRQVRSSEKGPFLSPNSEPCNSEPCQGLEFVERTGPNLGSAVRSSEKGTGPASISFQERTSQILVFLKVETAGIGFL